MVRAYPRQEVAWHAKKRIAKKWRKQRGPRYVYSQVDKREILYDEQRGILYCYPEMQRELYQIVNEKV